MHLSLSDEFPIHRVEQAAAPVKQVNPLYEKRPKVFGEHGGRV